MAQDLGDMEIRGAQNDGSNRLIIADEIAEILHFEIQKCANGLVVKLMKQAKYVG